MKSTTKMSGKASGGMKGGMMNAGMTRHNPRRPDPSMTCKGGSVNADATRSGVAAPVKTIGPRSA